MKKILVNLFCIILLVSCKQQMKYDVSKWNDESDRGSYEYRNAMLDDLLENHNPKGMNIQELEELFGYIDYDSTTNQDWVSFEVYQEWEFVGIDPTYTKHLVLKLNKNKVVDSVYTKEDYH